MVVTEDGCENLTAGAPLEMDEVEATMREPGMSAWFGTTPPGERRMLIGVAFSK